jgi:flavin reductase (DIM6/NTAB) family NADH-FMN oxidoreductase RutF
VNVLPEGGKHLVAHFGKGFEAGEPAFAGVKVERHPGSAAVLADAHAWIDCRVAGRFDAGDHVLIVGRVVGGKVLHEGKPTTHVRKSGKHY